MPVTRPWLVAMAQQAAIDRVPGKGKCTGVDSLLVVCRTIESVSLDLLEYAIDSVTSHRVRTTA